MTYLRGLVPAQNSTNNIDARDVVGSKLDDENGDSIYSKLYILEKDKHCIEKTYPTLAAGLTVTGGAGAWQLGAFTTIIAPNQITSKFDLHFINIGAASASDTYELQLYSGADGAEVECGRKRFVRTTSSDTVSLPLNTPLFPANTQIKCKLASSSGGDDNIVMSVSYHEY